MNKILINLLIFIQLFSIDAEAIFDCDGRYFCSDESIFNKDYLESIKSVLGENKKEVFYLFRVKTVDDVPTFDISNRVIYDGTRVWVYDGTLIRGNFNMQYDNFSIAVIWGGFQKRNRQNSKYLYFYNNSIKDNIIVDNSLRDKNGQEYETLKSGNDSPVVFQLKIVSNKIERYQCFFCSGLDIFARYYDKEGKYNNSLFKNDCIKEVKIIAYIDDIYCINNWFHDCKNLEAIDLDNSTHREVEIVGINMFKNCENLKDLKMTDLISYPEANEYMFINCPKLENITFNTEFNLKYDDIKNIENLKNINMIDKNFQTKKLENITKEDKLDIFLSSADRYIKLREYYKKATPTEINFLNKYDYASKGDSVIKRELDNRIKGVHDTKIDKNRPKINTPGTPNCCCECCLKCCSECCKTIGG